VRAALAITCVLAAACASTLPRPEQNDPRAVRIFRGGGEAASWADLVEAASSADVVVLGENHGHPIGLAAAAALFDDVLARAPYATLSLEFFERDEQSRLDDYLAGIADAETLERRTGRKPGNFPAGHRAMVEAAKRAGRPVHASNAPWAYATLARKEGYERLARLTPEQRRLFAIPIVLFGGRYRADFDALMTTGDVADGSELELDAEQRERLDHTFRAQSLWDWTMADSIDRGLANGEHPVVHVVGRFHSDFRGGLIQALDRLHPGPRVVVVSFVDAWSDTLAEADRDRGDFVIYVGPGADGD
jgi:uncharacterized iron-regulated protein